MTSAEQARAFNLLREKIERFLPDGFRDEDGVWHEGPHRRDALVALSAAEAELREAREALRILLRGRGCLAPDGTAEIWEALSAAFDITADEADTVIAALARAGEGE